MNLMTVTDATQLLGVSRYRVHEVGRLPPRETGRHARHQARRFRVRSSPQPRTSEKAVRATHDVHPSHRGVNDSFGLASLPQVYYVSRDVILFQSKINPRPGW